MANAAGGELAAPVAQLVEHVLGKDEASGSKPLGGFFKSKSSVTPLDARPSVTSGGARKLD